jgi:hypothetical protein
MGGMPMLRRSCGAAGSRIEPALEDVDEEVHHENEHGKDRDCPIDQPVVAVRGRLDKMLPETGETKDRLDHKGAANETGEGGPR